MVAPVRRVLVLHGFCETADILRWRMRKLCATCAGEIEFVFVDAPFIQPPIDLSPTGAEGPDPGTEDVSVDSPVLRTWWSRAYRLEPALSILRDLLMKDRYEGIWGFSQGAAIAAVLVAALERPYECPAILDDGRPPHPPLKYFISVGGFRPPTSLADHLLAIPYSTSTLHVIGTNDVVSPLERVTKLIVLGANTRVVWHTGGHFVPVRKSWPKFFHRYMSDPHTSMLAPGERTSAVDPAAEFTALANEAETPISAVSAPSTVSDDGPPAYSAPTLDANPTTKVSVGVQVPCLSPDKGQVYARTRSHTPSIGKTIFTGGNRWGDPDGDGVGWASVLGLYTAPNAQDESLDCFSFISG